MDYPRLIGAFTLIMAMQSHLKGSTKFHTVYYFGDAWHLFVVPSNYYPLIYHTVQKCLTTASYYCLRLLAFLKKSRCSLSLTTTLWCQHFEIAIMKRNKRHLFTPYPVSQLGQMSRASIQYLYIY